MFAFFYVVEWFCVSLNIHPMTEKGVADAVKNTSEGHDA